MNVSQLMNNTSGSAGAGQSAHHPYGDISTLIITYLANRAFCADGSLDVEVNEMIVEIASNLAVMRAPPVIKAIPHKDTVGYAVALNEFSSVMMIVLDQLAEKEYLVVSRNPVNKMILTCRLNLESDYIKQFTASYGKTLKYVTHPAFQVGNGGEEALSEMLQQMQISGVKRKAEHLAPIHVPTPLPKPVSDPVSEPLPAVMPIEVPSERDPKIRYQVTASSCTCPAFKYHPEIPCKHIQSALPAKGEEEIKQAKQEEEKEEEEAEEDEKEEEENPLLNISVKMVIPVQDPDPEHYDNFSMVYSLSDGRQACGCADWTEETGCFHTYLLKSANGIYVSAVIKRYDEEEIHMTAESFNKLSEGDLLIYYGDLLGGMFPLDRSRRDYQYFTSKTILRAPYIHVFDDSRVPEGSHFDNRIKVKLNDVNVNGEDLGARYAKLLIEIEAVALVQSNTDPELYYNVYHCNHDSWCCTCDGYIFSRKSPKSCKHIEAMKNRNSHKGQPGAMVEVPVKVSAEETWEPSYITPKVVRLHPGTRGFETYIDLMAADLPNGILDTEYFTHRTIFYGAWNLPENEEGIADFTVGNPKFEEAKEAEDFDPLDYLEDDESKGLKV